MSRPQQFRLANALVGFVHRPFTKLEKRLGRNGEMLLPRGDPRRACAGRTAGDRLGADECRRTGPEGGRVTDAGTVHAALFGLKNGRTNWDRHTVVVVVDEAAMLDSRVTGELRPVPSPTRLLRPCCPVRKRPQALPRQRCACRCTGAQGNRFSRIF